ncbi:guanine deaminase [Altericista sp. CCNU0014]|uniref:guanine deaminase n=1 Tax=Altericista sp. CCNU0014 TaxID=3082949 RepID=UPI00384B4CD0
MSDVVSALSPSVKAIRGAFWDCVDDPFYKDEAESVRYLPDGLLILDRGQIKAFGPYERLKDLYSSVETTVYPAGMAIVPGFIDLHVHYPQTEMIASYGAQLLEWLDKYTFPTEAKFADAAYARKIAAFFLDELLKNGTTTALVLPTIFPQSVEVLFEEAQKRNMRLIAGQVLMSRNAPEFLLTEPKIAYAQTREQIQRWHGNGRMLYAITPRFAITSTDEELALAGQLKAEFPEVYVHTHLSENRAEVAFTAELFPDSTDYLNVYERFGLVGDRSIFAHCVQLDDSAFERLSDAGATIAFCPTSNLFLGSGLFRLGKAKSTDHPVKVGLATDVGGGTSFSMLQTMSDAYKIMQLQGESLSVFRAFYLATLGAAKALSVGDKLGNFEVGKEADFIVLDTQATPLMKLRNPTPESVSLSELADKAFAMMLLGDDRTVKATYVAGALVHSRRW